VITKTKHFKRGIMKNLPIDEKSLLSFLIALLNTPSPTGFAEPAISFCEEAFSKIPDAVTSHTRKGALLVTIPGEHEDAPRALTAHVDTLGAMVKEIKSSGRLTLTQIGGYAWNSIEGEGCTVVTHSGEKIRGSILLTTASTHVFGAQVNETKRSGDNMEVRLDVVASTQEQIRTLGIEVGDFVILDPRVEVVNGFVRSRHLDDKAGVACILAALRALSAAGQKPWQTTHILISNYEEVGHGAAAGLPAAVCELVAVDMAAVGAGQNSDEFHSTLCIKDSGGPYHHELSHRLRQLAEENNIAYKVDIYPYYGSDGEAWWRAGGDAAVALIGPGVDASHSYERTHTDALLATSRWVLAYLTSK
jgi:putative aminopeptidase FrvX